MFLRHAECQKYITALSRAVTRAPRSRQIEAIVSLAANSLHPAINFRPLVCAFPASPLPPFPVDETGRAGANPGPFTRVSRCLLAIFPLFFGVGGTVPQPPSLVDAVRSVESPASVLAVTVLPEGHESVLSIAWATGTKPRTRSIATVTSRMAATGEVAGKNS